jgi:hypothetical protein
MQASARFEHHVSLRLLLVLVRGECVRDVQMIRLLSAHYVSLSPQSLVWISL